MIWNPFSKKVRNVFTDEKKTQFATLIAEALSLQLSIVSNRSMDSINGGPKPKAIGYVYGYIDAVITASGWNMAEPDVGIPIFFQVVRRIWPDKAREYVDYFSENTDNPEVLAGCMHGGQQYLDSLKPENASNVGMGLARYILTEV